MSAPYLHKAVAEQLQVFNGVQHTPGDIVGIALDNEKLLCRASHPVNDANVGPFLRHIAEPFKNTGAKEVVFLLYGPANPDLLKNVEQIWGDTSPLPASVYGVDGLLMASTDGSTELLDLPDSVALLPTRAQIADSFRRDPSLQVPQLSVDQIRLWHQDTSPSAQVADLCDFLECMYPAALIPPDKASQFGSLLHSSPDQRDAVILHLLNHPGQVESLKQLYLVVPEEFANEVGMTLAATYWLNGDGRSANCVLESRPEIANKTSLGELVHISLSHGINPSPHRKGLMESSQEFTQRIAQADMEWAAHSPAAQANEMNTPPSMLGANQFDRPNLSGPFIGL